MNKRRLLFFLIVFDIALALAAGGFVWWAETPPTPLPAAFEALKSDAQVTVTEQPWLVFSPAESATTGFIFYPGGRVDERAYAPLARALAERGVLAVITPMPLHLAVFGVDRAGDVMRAYPRIEHWVLAGHSLGGSMAANYALDHAAELDGLALLASYPASGDDLTRAGLAVISISGELDGLATPEKIEASRTLLPADTQFVQISGGNHAQFGSYGAQSGDQPARISPEEQLRQTAAALLGWMEQATARP